MLESGIVRIESASGVDETLYALQAFLAANGVKVFALVDHSGEAAKAGLQMPPTKLLIFGNPKAGTPLMLASPSAALDLPLKILIAEESDGKVWVSYNSVEYLQQRHGFPADLLQNIAVMDGIARKIAQ
ncbi:MAG: DUF302 domain-containing protein [Acidobacteriaceae bacterium]